MKAKLKIFIMLIIFYNQHGFSQTTISTGTNKYILLEAYAGCKYGYGPGLFCLEELITSNNAIIVNNHNNSSSEPPLLFSNTDQWNLYVPIGGPFGTIDRQGAKIRDLRFNDSIIERLNDPANSARYKVDMTISRSGQLLTVFLSCKALTNLIGEYRFNVFITEDSILYKQSNFGQTWYPGCIFNNNSTSPILNFPNRHVLRAYLGTEWGIFKCLNPSINQIDTMTFHYTIPSDFKINKLSVIGLIQKYDSLNVSNRMIMNAIKSDDICGSVGSFILTKSYNNRICDSIELSTPVIASKYIWYRNGILLDTIISNKRFVKLSGKYQVKISNGTGCYDTSNCLIISRFDDELIPQICAVSVDSASGKNEIIWEKSGITQATQYNIYRENSLSQFVLIGTKAANLFSTFIDTSSIPLQQSYRYKLTLTDSCGKETWIDSSKSHKTVHLTSNVGTSGEVNLIWNIYDGKAYSSHKVMRSVNGGPLISIASLSNNVNSYSDLSPPSGTLKYRIDLSSTICAPTAKTNAYNSITSNPVSISRTGLINPVNDLFKIIPNPTLEGKVRITSTFSIVNIEIANTLGQRVFTDTYDKVIVELDLSFLEKGVYFVKINNTYYKKLIVE